MKGSGGTETSFYDRMLRRRLGATPPWPARRCRRLCIALRYRSSSRLAFVALVLVLLAQAQDFPQDLDVEALSLGLGEDFLLALRSAP